MSEGNHRNREAQATSRFGTVAIVGRTNVGKSTFLNAALGESLAITSPLPQTTRDVLLGVAHHGDCQIAFVDTPGLHRPRSELGRRMNAVALGAARTTDVLVFMTDVSSLIRRPKGAPAVSESNVLSEEDVALIGELGGASRAIAVINKIDLVRNKSLLLPLLAALEGSGRFEALIPVSVAARDGTDRVLDEIAARLPEGAGGYDSETLTDRPVVFFVREYIREQVLLTTGREVPHAVAVTVDAFESGRRLVVIKATIHVEKKGQRGILVGKGGEKLKEIGTAARHRIEELVGQKVHLELFVRVTPRWKDMPRQLAELGYDTPGIDVVSLGDARKRSS